MVMVRIETSSGTAAEEHVKGVLGGLLEKYDASAWEFTDRVVIEEGAIPHSHPVLTLGTRFIVRTPLGVLSTYLHEQMHWCLGEPERSGVFAAIDELRQVYPEVPDREHGGADDEDSTYLHLVVNWLELEALRAVAGADAADATLRQAVNGPVYGWVYERVFADHAVIADIARRHALDPSRP